jgi:ribonuclease-3
MSLLETEWPEPAPQRAEELRRFLQRWDLAPKRLGVFDLSLTHSSYAFENNLPDNNERLEFLGDTVLGFSVACWLFETSPKEREGTLSKMKSALVSRSVLGRRARAMEIGPLILLGRGDLKTGVRRSSVLGSALESLIGAVYLDLGLEAAREFIVNHIAIPSQVYTKDTDLQDYKSALQEIVQKRYHEPPHYQIISRSGPDHARNFVVEVSVQGRPYGRGHGSRVKIAQNQAARAARDDLLQELEEADEAQTTEGG